MRNPRKSHCAKYLELASRNRLLGKYIVACQYVFGGTLYKTCTCYEKSQCHLDIVEPVRGSRQIRRRRGSLDNRVQHAERISNVAHLEPRSIIAYRRLLSVGLHGSDFLNKDIPWIVTRQTREREKKKWRKRWDERKTTNSEKVPIKANRAGHLIIVSIRAHVPIDAAASRRSFMRAPVLETHAACRTTKLHYSCILSGGARASTRRPPFSAWHARGRTRRHMPRLHLANVYADVTEQFPRLSLFLASRIFSTDVTTPGTHFSASPIKRRAVFNRSANHLRLHVCGRKDRQNDTRVVNVDTRRTPS